MEGEQQPEDPPKTEAEPDEESGNSCLNEVGLFSGGVISNFNLAPRQHFHYHPITLLSQPKVAQTLESGLQSVPLLTIRERRFK